MMNVQVKSSNGITLVPVDSKLMANRKIFIERLTLRKHASL